MRDAASAGVHGAWWFPQSSKLMRPDDVGLGGFDSHALPPRHSPAPVGRPASVRGLRARRSTLAPWVLCVLCVLCVLGSPFSTGPLEAQVQTPTARSGIAPPADTGRAPISSTRAFLYSLALPGLGQAKLDRPIVGAGFFLMEAFAIALVHRTADDLRLARAYRRDSIPLRYAVNEAAGIASRDGYGNPLVAAWEPNYYRDALVRARRLQLEDWTAILVFNHLIAGAEAFVAAQLWDLPQHVKLRVSPVRGGLAVTARLRIR